MPDADLPVSYSYHILCSNVHVTHRYNLTYRIRINLQSKVQQRQHQRSRFFLLPLHRTERPVGYTYRHNW